MPPHPEAKQMRLLSSVPAKVDNRLVARYPFETDRDYAAAFHFSAKRLADTFTGKPEDDCLLLPFLTLYRQAFELELKHTIKALIGIRMTYIDGVTPELEAALRDKRFRNDLRHNLHKLLNEAKEHYAALHMPQDFPQDVEKLIIMMHEADNAGTAFRYSGQLPEIQGHADFPNLAALLDDQFTMLTFMEDYVDGSYSEGPTLKDMGLTTATRRNP